MWWFWFCFGSGSVLLWFQSLLFGRVDSTSSFIVYLQRAGVRPPRWTPPRASPITENGEIKRKTLSKSSTNSAQSDTSENARYVFLNYSDTDNTEIFSQPL